MSVKIGISPIAWQNDDLPELTAAYTMEQALREAREIGYTGVERGQRMPHDTEGLRAYLEANDIALCGGWCSGNTLVNSVEAECAAIAPQVAQFVALGSPCIVYAECSNTVQGLQGVPVNARPRLSRDELLAYAAKLTEVAKWVTDQGMPFAYHHHMGSIVEAEEDVNWLMEGSGPEVRLCFDTGHLLFGGGDVLATMDRWADRILHVHFKDIRPEVVKDVRETDRSRSIISFQNAFCAFRRIRMTTSFPWAARSSDLRRKARTSPSVSRNSMSPTISAGLERRKCSIWR